MLINFSNIFRGLGKSPSFALKVFKTGHTTATDEVYWLAAFKISEFSQEMDREVLI